MSRAPRLTKKPLPRSRSKWDRERAGIELFLLRCHDIKDEELTVWKRKMLDYYRTRLRDLETHPPKGVKPR